MKKTEEQLVYWVKSPNENTNLYATQTDGGIHLIVKSKGVFSTIDEDGTTYIHLKRETAAALSNLISETLIKNPNDEKDSHYTTD